MIVFTDTETTGLDETSHYMLEVAYVVTDDKLREIGAVSSVVRTEESLDQVMSKMDSYVLDMHTKNGLIEELHNTPPRAAANIVGDLRKKVTAAFAYEPAVMSDRCGACKLPLAKHVWDCDTVSPKAYCRAEATSPARPSTQPFVPVLQHPLSQTPMAGSTVSFDRRWQRRHMSEIESLFHHRSIDVSSIVEMARRFAPDVYNSRPRSTDTHRALADARGSIALLQYFLRNGLFGKSGTVESHG